MSDDAPILSRAALVDAGGLYLTGEDNFRLRTFGSVAGLVLALEGRRVQDDGQVVPFAERHVPSSNYLVKEDIFPIGAGLVTNVQLRATTGTPLRGAVYALLEIIRGRDGAVQPLATLLQGYVTANARLAWPGAPIDSSINGAGRVRLITGTNPAPGVEIVETVPAGARWKLRSFRFVLVASAAAANRRPVLTIDDGAAILWETSSAVDQVASQTATYAAGVGVPFFTYGTRAYHLPLPGEFWLPAGARIRTVTALLDAGDDYAAPIYEVEEFIEG